MASVYAKISEVQQQVLYLSKLVQRTLTKQNCGGSRDTGSYCLPNGVVLPFDTHRQLMEVESLLSDENVAGTLVCLLSLTHFLH